MTNLYFPVCGFFVASLLVTVFFSKKRIKNDETKWFSGLLLTSFFDSILMVAIIYIAYVNPSSKSLYILNRLDFLQYVFWARFFFLYFYEITFRTGKKKKSNMPLITFISNIVIFAFIIVMPLHIHTKNDIMFASGESVNILYGACAFYFVMILICVICNLKKIRNKKFLPLLALIILVFIIFIVRSVTPGLLIIPAMLSYIDLIMIFTIENPDVKMIYELNRNKKLLESMSEEKSNFLFSMTQDTKKPIDNILEVSKILLDDKNKEDMKTGIKVIENNARGLKNIINNVLDISNISSSKLVVSNETYNAISLLNECIKKIEKDVNKNVTIETEISKNIPGELYGDSVKLKQVIMSILINASKYTKEGYIKVSANEIVKYDVCRLIIEIEDSGCGMSVDKLNELLKTNTDLEDTDLLKLNSLDVDLKLAFKIIRKLGGFINVRSEKEKGSTFTIILDQKIKVSKDYYSEYIFNKKKVMVVSDKLQTLKDINTLASKYDIELLTTMHSSDIIERVKDGESFDLILLEDDMKPISGFGTLGKLQEAKEGFNVPTVIMLNKNKESIKDHYVEDGFSNYIRKQNLEEDFDKVIKKYI